MPSLALNILIYYSRRLLIKNEIKHNIFQEFFSKRLNWKAIYNWCALITHILVQYFYICRKNLYQFLAWEKIEFHLHSNYTAINYIFFSIETRIFSTNFPKIFKQFEHLDTWCRLLDLPLIPRLLILYFLWFSSFRKLNSIEQQTNWREQSIEWAMSRWVITCNKLPLNHILVTSKHLKIHYIYIYYFCNGFMRISREVKVLFFSNVINSFISRHMLLIGN